MPARLLGLTQVHALRLGYPDPAACSPRPALLSSVWLVFFSGGAGRGPQEAGLQPGMDAGLRLQAPWLQGLGLCCIFFVVILNPCESPKRTLRFLRPRIYNSEDEEAGPLKVRRLAAKMIRTGAACQNGSDDVTRAK